MGIAMEEPMLRSAEQTKDNKNICGRNLHVNGIRKCETSSDTFAVETSTTSGQEKNYACLFRNVNNLAPISTTCRLNRSASDCNSNNRGGDCCFSPRSVSQNNRSLKAHLDQKQYDNLDSEIRTTCKWPMSDADHLQLHDKQPPEAFQSQTSLRLVPLHFEVEYKSNCLSQTNLPSRNTNNKAQSKNPLFLDYFVESDRDIKLKKEQSNKKLFEVHKCSFKDYVQGSFNNFLKMFSREGLPSFATKTKRDSNHALIILVFCILQLMISFAKAELHQHSAQNHPEQHQPVGMSPNSEDRDYWYQQAQAQLNDVLEARLNAIKGPAKNVILFIGDGMGLSTITAGRILKGQKLGYSGEEYQLSFEKFPHIALAKTYTADSQIGDSTGCATALMCGVKANVNTVGLDKTAKFEDCFESFNAQVPSVIDWAQKHGKSTGIVTNTRLTHGTPSALYAHSASRYWEDDSRMPERAKVVCKDIARQLIEEEPGRNINVLLGGGRRHLLPMTEFDREESDQRGRRTDGRHLVDEWVHDKKQRSLHAEYVWNKGQFDQIDPRRTDYLLGVFGYSHLDFEVDRQKGSSGDPSLVEMTVKAIQILQKNPKGFFLMVEGGRIDHAHHHNNARRALEEVVALDDAIYAALQHTNPAETLIVVTTDHSHVMTFGGDNTPRGNPVTGFDASLSDLDHKPYTTILYGNGPGYAHATPSGRHNLSSINPQDVNFVQQAAVPRKYETHSGEDVPVYATGPGSYLFSGTVEQTYIAHAIAHAACMASDSAHCEKPPSDDASAAKSHHHHHHQSALHPNGYPVPHNYPNIAPNIYQPNMLHPDIYEPASSPVEERKYDPNSPYGRNMDPNIGRTNGFNREFGFWSAAVKLRPTVLLLTLVSIILFVG